MTPKAALVDIGNVLLSFDFESALLRLIPASAPDPQERIASLLERKDEYESGLIGEDEFIDWASGRLGFTGSSDHFRATWRSIFEPIPAMWEAIAGLKARGLQLHLFSNINSIHGPWILSSYPVFDHFDGRIFSYEVGAVKPDPRIYEAALGQLDLPADAVLYIDDLADNVAAGKRFGLRTHQYDRHDHPAFQQWLDGELR